MDKDEMICAGRAYIASTTLRSETPILALA